MEVPNSTRRSLAVLVVSVLAASLLLLPGLSTWSGDFCVWEAGVLEGFAEALRANTSSLRYLGDRLLLSEGLVSNSEESLLYGAPTYFLFRTFGASIGALRLAPALLALAGAIAAWCVVRREWGDVAGGAAAVLMATSPVVAFYGRWGSSITATIFCLWLVFGAAWSYLARPRSTGRALLLGLAFVVATLHYSPARILALALLGLSVLVVLYRSARSRQLPPASLAALLGVLALFVGYQVSARRIGSFSSARGEHVFQMLREPPQIKELLGVEQDPATLTVSQKVRFAAVLVSRNLGNLGRLSIPRLTYPVFEADPPWNPLFPLVWAPFLAVGLGVAVVRIRDVRYLGLLASSGLVLAALLLTNRTDLHRMTPLLVPVVALTAVGLAFLVEAARKVRVPWPVLAGAGVLAILLAARDLRSSRQPEPMPRSPQSEAILELFRKHPGPLRLCLDVDARAVGWGILADLVRSQGRPPAWPTMVPEGIRHELRSSDPAVMTRACIAIEYLADEVAVALGPAEAFAEAEKRLTKMGLRLSRVGNVELPMLLVEKSGSGPPAEPPPAPERGPEQPLSSLEPVSQHLEFGGLGRKTTFDGAPLRLRGRLFQEGLGMHAPSQVVYAVPPGANAFHALVGVGDEVRDCAEALASFEVRDEEQKLLFRSRRLGPRDAPAVVRVSVKGLSQIVLITDDGGNGRDCDHGVWANAAFELEPVRR